MQQFQQTTSLPVNMAESGLHFIHSVGAEFGTELMLFSLFLIGFGFFRSTVVRHALGMRVKRSSKASESKQAAAAKEVVCEVSADIFAATSESELPVSAPQSKPKGKHDEVAAVLDKMFTRGMFPSVVTYNSHVSAAMAQQDSSEAWRLVVEMDQKGVKADSFTCSMLLQGMKQSVDMDKIMRLIERARITPDEVLVTGLLEACVRVGDAARLATVFDRFTCAGVVPSQRACAMLIKAYGHARRSERAWEVWNEVLGRDSSQGLTEDVFVNMAEVCIICGDLEGVAAVLRQALPSMEAFARAPAVFAVVVKALVQSTTPQLALDLYGELSETITCTKATYNTLIDSLVRQNEMISAADLFRDMALQGVTPDLITYSTVIKGHCLGGNLEQGVLLLGLMQRRGIMPDAVLFNSILEGCAQKQMRFMTETVLKDMEKAGVVPSNHTLSILVKFYGRCNDLKAAFDVVEKYPTKFGFNVNAQVYTCLMSACIANGDQVRALSVYDTMIAAGCAADAKTFQTLLKGCVMHNDVDGASRLVNDVFRKGTAASMFSNSVDRQTLEGILLMAVRQGRTSDVAMPMLCRFQDANICISERICSAVRGR